MKWLSVYTYYADWVAESLVALSASTEADGGEGGGKYKFISEPLNSAAGDGWRRDHGVRGVKDPYSA